MLRAPAAGANPQVELTMARRVTAIVNPVSGRREMLSVVRRIGQLVTRGGGRFDTLQTETAGHAAVLAAQLRSEVDAVLVVGGDGTVGEVINGLAGRAIPLAILRTGTENLLARELGMPTDSAGLARLLLEGETRACDVGVANGKSFAAMVGVGLDAECVLRMTETRCGHIGRTDYFWPIWRTFWTHRFPPLAIEADGATVFEGRGLAFVGNISRYGGGVRILRDARIDDGWLDLCVLPCSSRIVLIPHLIRVYLRRHVSAGGTIYQKCRRVRISSPVCVPVQVDGDVGGFLPVECSVAAKRVQFLRLACSGDLADHRAIGSAD